VARGGMSAKLQAARRALAAGVTAVRISDVSALANPGVGTRLTNAHSPA
jgi:glutamate 5-kinase